jgi:hypothetical protein
MDRNRTGDTTADLTRRFTTSVTVWRDCQGLIRVRNP